MTDVVTEETVRSPLSMLFVIALVGLVLVGLALVGAAGFVVGLLAVGLLAVGLDAFAGVLGRGFDALGVTAVASGLAT